MNFLSFKSKKNKNEFFKKSSQILQDEREEFITLDSYKAQAYLKKKEQNDADRVRLQRIRLQKKQQQKNLILIAILSFTILLTYFAISSIFKRGDNLYKLSFITQDSIFNSIESRAMIVRGESLLSSDIEGETIALAAAGAKLPYGAKLSMVVRENIDQLQSELEAVELQIAKRRDHLIASGAGKEATQVYKRYDEQLAQQAKLIASLKVQGQYSNLLQIENYIKSLLEARAIRLNKLELGDVILIDPLKQRDLLIRKIEEKSKTYFLPDPGIVSYSYDQREPELNIDSVNNMDFDSLLKFYQAEENFKSAIGNEKSNIIGRLVDEMKQYFVIYLPNKEASMFADKNTMDLYIPQEGLTINNAKLIKRLSNESDTFFIVETHDGLQQLLNQRYVKLQIKTRVETGFKVPNSALEFIKEKKEEDQKAEAYLTIVQNGKTKKVLVRVLLSNETDSIIEALENSEIKFGIGTVIILNAHDLIEGKDV